MLAALGICGCGGGLASSSSERQQFVARADKLCAAALLHVKQLEKPSEAGSAIYVKAGRLIANLANELVRVQPPDAERAAYARFIASIRREVGYIAELGRALRAKDRAALARTVRKLEANPVNREANALGLATCAQTAEPGH